LIARIARAVSRLLGVPVGRKGIHVRQSGMHVLLKTTEFRTLLTPKNARVAARALDQAAWDAEAEQRLREAAAAGGAP
jgi:hypothetical protein